MLKLDNFFDELFGGELPVDIISTIYGPPGAGKSTICFEYTIACLNQGKKVFFVDTEGGFSAERLKQLNPDVDLSQIVVFSPKSFEEQEKVILSLNKQIKSSDNVGLIIVDSLVMLYRLKLGDSPQKINAALGEQLRQLNEVSRNFDIPVLVTNQVYTNFDTKEKKMIGGTLIEYWSKAIVEIDNEDDYKKAVLKKHKFKKSGVEKLFVIENEGILEYRERGFSFFRH